MGDDELFLLVVSLIVLVMLGSRWYWPLIRSRQAPRADRAFATLFWAPPAALAGVFLMLRYTASYDVQDDFRYLLLYAVLGAAWFMAAALALTWLNISYRDDALERRNPAAQIVVVSVMLGHAAIYAGGNMGDGPGWWTVVVAAGLGSGAWFLLWWVAENLVAQSEAITVGRDVPAAIRLSGYALAMGAVCARAAAGDWTSLSRTVEEFKVVWPVIPLSLAYIGIELALRRMQQRHSLLLSALIALVLLAAATAAVVMAGGLPQNPLYDALRPLP